MSATAEKAKPEDANLNTKINAGINANSNVGTSSKPPRDSNPNTPADAKALEKAKLEAEERIRLEADIRQYRTVTVELEKSNALLVQILEKERLRLDENEMYTMFLKTESNYAENWLSAVTEQIEEFKRKLTNLLRNKDDSMEYYRLLATWKVIDNGASSDEIALVAKGPAAVTEVAQLQIEPINPVKSPEFTAVRPDFQRDLSQKLSKVSLINFPSFQRSYTDKDLCMLRFGLFNEIEKSIHAAKFESQLKSLIAKTRIQADECESKRVMLENKIFEAQIKIPTINKERSEVYLKLKETEKRIDLKITKYLEDAQKLLDKCKKPDNKLEKDKSGEQADQFKSAIEALAPQQLEQTPKQLATANVVSGTAASATAAMLPLQEAFSARAAVNVGQTNTTAATTPHLAAHSESTSISF